MKLIRHRFLWVSLQIESLCDNRRIKLEEDLVDELARLPQSLAGMYSLILGNISRIEQHGRTVAETVFRWLLCTNDAGSKSPLQHARVEHRPSAEVFPSLTFWMSAPIW